jgi:hypothetical protein
MNCAHEKSRMVENLRAARRQTGKSCEIAFDLAGPKLRTGDFSKFPNHWVETSPKNELGQIDNAGTLQDRMRQQEVGCFGAFIQREDCDQRLARATRFQSLSKACVWHSAIAALTGVGATCTLAPVPASATAPMTGQVSAQLSDVL